MVDGSSAEHSVEFFGSELSEVFDGERPQVKDIVPGEGASLLDQFHIATQEETVDG